MNQITQSLDLIGWTLLIFGWILYWFKKLDEARQANKNKGILSVKQWGGIFIQDNLFELPVSLISCFVLAILSSSIPSDIIDMKGRVSIFIVGYSASSIINGLITKFKK